ncbi:MAG: hypothetical protein K8S27_08655 [Candidatus Omnitrophica bacterium]|nr:hypothetical protein [Candidatus Omnitrophota bacterium]
MKKKIIKNKIYLLVALLLLIILFAVFYFYYSFKKNIFLDKEMEFEPKKFDKIIYKSSVVCEDELKNKMISKFYDNGIIKQIYNCKNGIVDGNYLEYTENGKLYIEQKYDKGKLNKNYIRQYEYYPNGNIAYEYYFNAGDGYLNKFYEDGQLLSRTIMKFGKKYVYIEYSEDGEVKTHRKKY